MVISKKTIIFKGFRWVQHFPGGGVPPTFQGGGRGLNANFYRNGYTVVIFEGGSDPIPHSGSAYDWIRVG